jgi:flagellar biogenesis protein FliO
LEIPVVIVGVVAAVVVVDVADRTLVLADETSGSVDALLPAALVAARISTDGTFVDVFAA